MGKDKKVAKQKDFEAQLKGAGKGLKRIGAKVTLLGVLIVFLSLTITISIAKSFAQNRLTESELDGLSNIATEKAISLEQYVADQKAIAQLVQTNSTVIEQAMVYDATGEMDPTYQKLVANSLKTLFDNTGNIYENLFVTVGSEGFADCLDNATLHSVKEENFYIECQQNGYYFGNNVSPVTGRPVYVIAYAINNPQTGKMIGSVNMSIDMAALGRDIVTSDKYMVTVVDHEGYIIATNGPEEDILQSVGDADSIGGMLGQGKGTMLVDLTEYGMGSTYLAFTATDNFILEVSLDVAEVVAPAKEMGRNLTFVAVFFSIIAIVLMIVLVKVVVNPLKSATADVTVVIEEIENGKGDLTRQIPIKSNDEIGLMIKGINDLLRTMKNLISNVQNTTNNVSVSSSNISEEIGKAEMEISNVSSTMEQMSASSQETSASLTQVLIQVDGVAELVESVNRQSIEEARYADAVVNKVQDIQEKSIEERKIANQHLQEVTENLRVKIENAKQVQEIANLTDEILSITSQTNLLSLNASIEAARAGEAGKGFAVVADEIRQLADSSKEAANRIQEVTENVIVAVEALASEAENVTEFMITNNEEGHKNTDELTESYAGDIQKLAEAMGSFKTSSDEIQQSMSAIKEAIDAVNIAAEETAEGITNVATSTVELSNNLQAVVGKTTENVVETNSLNDEMSKFKV